MFCPKCGKEIPDGARFCSGCGNPIAAHTTDTSSINNGAGTAPNTKNNNNGYGYFSNYPSKITPGENSVPQKASKKMIVLIVTFIVIMLAVIAVIFVKNIPPKIVLSDYVTVKTSGYDGHGKATAQFNVKKFCKDYRGKLKFTPSGKELTMEFGSINQGFGRVDYDTVALQLFTQFANGDLENSSNLSNGDVVRYCWSSNELRVIKKYFHVRLDSTPYTYKVSGLKEKN